MSRFPRHEIDPDEIFLDSENLPAFDTHQMEGRIEHPISRTAIALLGIVIVLFLFSGVSRLFSLQVNTGTVYATRAEENRLHNTPIIAPRGVITDRRGVELAWNIPGGQFPRRAYHDSPAFAHTLGYVSEPKKDENGFYYQESFEGKDGVERTYDELLRGAPGVQVAEVDARGDVQSANVIRAPEAGPVLELSLDSRITQQLYKELTAHGTDRNFRGGAGVILDVKTGEVIALTSYPSFDPQIIADGAEDTAIARILNDTRQPLLNRAISGLYAPGSSIKPYVGIGALNEGVITPRTTILANGEIEIPNPYNSDEPSVFSDLRSHGWIAIREALAVSSNIFFYEVGGGFEDQEGIGIGKINEYLSWFGIGERTGIDIPGEAKGNIPNPQWKQNKFPGDPWRVGDTYHTAIGQYGFQVTPLQMARATAAIANDGKVLKPEIVKGAGPTVIEEINITPEHFEVIREGMREVVLEGTGQVLNIPVVEVAAKTGTAEVGVDKSRVHSWSTGYFPYENPRYAFAVMLESGPRDNNQSVSFVVRRLLEWMAEQTPEYLHEGA